MRLVSWRGGIFHARVEERILQYFMHIINVDVAHLPTAWYATIQCTHKQFTEKKKYNNDTDPEQNSLEKFEIARKVWQ